MQYGQARLARRMMRAMPWLGGLVAVATVGAAVRRKGLLGGTVDTALDAVPFVGATKNALEIWRGQDFIRDRVRVRALP
jgi:hypothetical protein